MMTSNSTKKVAHVATVTWMSRPNIPGMYGKPLVYLAIAIMTPHVKKATIFLTSPWFVMRLGFRPMDSALGANSSP